MTKRYLHYSTYLLFGLAEELIILKGKGLRSSVVKSGRLFWYLGTRDYICIDPAKNELTRVNGLEVFNDNPAGDKISVDSETAKCLCDAISYFNYQLSFENECGSDARNIETVFANLGSEFIARLKDHLELLKQFHQTMAYQPASESELFILATYKVKKLKCESLGFPDLDRFNIAFSAKNTIYQEFLNHVEKLPKKSDSS